MLSKLAAWVIYHAFIYFSKHVSFQDFTRIWNEAYEAHVGAEWKKMKALGLIGEMKPLPPVPSYTSCKPQVDSAAYQEASAKGRRYGPTWPPQDLVDGQDEKPLLKHSQE